MKDRSIILFSLYSLIYILFIVAFNVKIQGDDIRMKANIGSEFIINKDTLKVVDYSIFSNTYTLSNGIEVNHALIENK